MRFQSKKDETIFAELGGKDEKFKTSILVYLTGDKAGKSVNVTDATLKRWWRKVNEEEEVKEEIKEESEFLKIELENEKTRETVEVEIDVTKNIPGIDDCGKKYDFNDKSGQAELKIPELVARIWQLGEEVYPSIEEVVEKVVSWGADVRYFGWYIRLADKTKILFRGNASDVKKSIIEVIMTEETSKRVKSFQVDYKFRKSAQCSGLPYSITIHSMADLEKLIKELY